ncbi:MAG: tyrosine-type recombinase/integrase [Chloroflexi bacterium]|nr:tyrosine-type recombinase/integrase [Chloroflexota bacterium]
MTALLANGVKDATEVWYRVRFRRFLDAYGDRNVRDMTLDDVRAYLVAIRGEDVSPYTRHGWVRAVRKLFKWLYEERKINDDFHRKIPLPKLPPAVPKGIAREDAIKMLEGCGGSPAGKRDKAIMLFFLDTGCRVGGLCDLKFEDLDLLHKRGQLLEKGDRTRIVMFGKRTSRALEEWLQVRPYPDNEFVFTSLSGDSPTNPNLVIQMLRRVKKRVGVSGRVNPHAFRHAFAREYLLNGGDLATLSQILGHSSLAVTKQYYAVFTMEELREKHTAFSPVRNLPETI